jgi:hypothetical protein
MLAKICILVENMPTFYQWMPKLPSKLAGLTGEGGKTAYRQNIEP